mgnify:CR=1 FL=1
MTGRKCGLKQSRARGPVCRRQAGGGRFKRREESSLFERRLIARLARMIHQPSTADGEALHSAVFSRLGVLNGLLTRMIHQPSTAVPRRPRDEPW